MNEASLTQILHKLGINEQKRQRSGWIDFRCPLAQWTHTSGTDRSMSAGAKIVPDGVSAWVCHACKHHGRISGLISAVQRFSGRIVPGLLREAEMADALPALTTDYGAFEQPAEATPSPLREPLYDGLYPFAHEVAEASAYLAARGISDEVSAKLRLLYDADQRRIMFEVRGSRGELWGYSGRAIDSETKPKIRDYHGLPKRRLILGEDRWVAGRPVLIVEGLFGYAHLWQVGANELMNIGALLGSVLTEEKAAILTGFDEPVYMMLDNDDAGDVGLFGPVMANGSREAASGAIARLQSYVPLYVPAWPDEKKDPDELTYEDVQRILIETPLFSS